MVKASLRRPFVFLFTESVVFFFSLWVTSNRPLPVWMVISVLGSLDCTSYHHPNINHGYLLDLSCVFNYLADFYHRYASSDLAVQSFCRNNCSIICRLIPPQVSWVVSVQP
ncbi:hypothetical protein BGW36DRAFT_380305 [Talaromyces proteolyticus]|uniref:Uncharacterized protein n=1 Tax=Talaromyces proteolyticus TaxID=1131652 RepID=A0AAD4KNU1_9EURO|nr:uncharacterized protein BGW36DRAFT_380305 [Talaromyces proteolyticus]KAH8696129.1 hypothetical protein BGW36DRAFT_380305 [Talaromyces proteolyticus]